MPYKSDAQRKFFHTNTAKKAGITEDEVNEFDKASKGKKLPEHVAKMANGGEAKPFNGLDDSTLQGLHDLLLKAQNGEDIHEAPKTDPSVEDEPKGTVGTFEVHASTDPAGHMGYAEGGEVKPSTMDGLKSLIQHAIEGTMGVGTRDLNAAENVDPVVTSSTDTAKGMARGGEIEDSADKEFHAAMKHYGAIAGIKTPGYADGGAVPPMQAPGMPVNGGYSGAGSDNLSALLQMLKTGGMDQLLPGSTTMNGMAQGIGQAVTDPGTAGIVNQATGANVQNPAPTPPPTDPAFMSKLNAGTAMTPPTPVPQPAGNPISQAMHNLNNTAPTPPDIYKGISAEDRANLMNQLLAQKSSPGMLAASGAAGLGDAISNSFGKGGQNAQGNLAAKANQNIEQRAGIIDTQRAQKMQDITAKMMVMKSDPSSSMSTIARQMYKQMTGKTAPSGVSAAQIESLNPLIEKQIETSAQKAIAGGEQAVNAGKALYGETWGDMVKELFGATGTETGAAALEKASGATPAAPASNGWSVVK
jgi:hypothetical protein